MKTSIFKYVSEHLDEDERFTASRLPDNLYDTIFRELGSDDAAVYTMNIPPNAEAARRLLKLLRLYLAEPVLPNRQKLYRTVKKMTMAEYCDPFIANFEQEEVNSIAYDLAYRFFYNSSDREPVKFALLLFGLYGMERIQKEDPQLWRDLVTIAHCEEFTFPFLYACRTTNFTPQKEVWQLLGCTHGWGKIFTIIDCECKSDADRMWLLRHGPEISVEYPPLSVKLLHETRLGKFLDEQTTPEIFKSAVAILGNYLVMLNSFSAEAISNQFNISSINIYILLTRLLRQAERLMAEDENPGYALDVINIGKNIKKLCAEQNYAYFSHNQGELLLAMCDKLAYSRDWREKIAAGLFEDDKVNYSLCELTYALGLSMWESLYIFWLDHPHEYQLFPYLFSFENDTQLPKLLRSIEKFLPEYSAEEDALLTPLRYLSSYPGQGSSIICAALNSPYDWPRGVACSVLDNWGAEQLTPALRDALHSARRLSNNKVINARIDSLLQSKKFSFEQFLDEN